MLVLVADSPDARIREKILADLRARRFEVELLGTQVTQAYERSGVTSFSDSPEIVEIITRPYLEAIGRLETEIRSLVVQGRAQGMTLSELGESA